MDVALLLALAVLLVLATLLGAAAFYFNSQTKKAKEDASKQIAAALEKGKSMVNLTEEQAIEKASQLAKNKLLEAEKTVLELESKAQSAARDIREKLKEQERILDERERGILSRAKSIDERANAIEGKERSIEQAKKDVAKVREDLGLKLQQIAGLTKPEAEKLLMDQVEKDLQDWYAKKVRENEDQIKFKNDEISKGILVETMVNAATDYVVETTTTTFTIDDEAMKGKIIGKDGRNIRTFEKLTGVDLIVDEAPNQVTLSCFDPIRREVGALALKKLLDDGRVHPGAIEETVEKVKKDLLKVIKKTGEDMAYETGFNNLPSEVIMLLGRFKYRFSFGQNLVKHTLEMVKIGESLALEMNADVQTVKLACLLHDIGKVAPEEGKQHHHISGEIARKYFKNNDKLFNAIEAHHFDIDAKYVESEIVRIADAISGARPGARRDSYEEYIKRVRALEDIARKHNGVKEAYAIHAGREVRVIVKPEDVNDEDTKVMAFKIAKEIEETQNYPGVIKVNVIRELRATEEAK
jgi:ribonucrease Y